MSLDPRRDRTWCANWKWKALGLGLIQQHISYSSVYLWSCTYIRYGMLESSKHREKWCWDRKIFIIDKYICIFLQEKLDSYNVYIYSHLLLQIYMNLNIVHFVQCEVHYNVPGSICRWRWIMDIFCSLFITQALESSQESGLCISCFLLQWPTENRQLNLLQ